jgi:hypothetical protein
MRSPALLLLALVIPACSSGSGPAAVPPVPCNQDPWECTSEQTCWPTSSSSYECLTAGPGALGSTCVDDVGTPTCGTGLACFQSLSSAEGSCVAYCSTTIAGHGCPGGQICATAELGGTGGPEFSVCVTEQVGGSDAGTEAGVVDSGSAGEAAAGD